MKNEDIYAFQRALFEVSGQLTSTEQELIFNERILPVSLGKDPSESISLADLAEVIEMPVDKVAAIEQQIYSMINSVQAQMQQPAEVEQGTEQPRTKLVKFKLKSDGYSSSWGGSSRFLDISCGACNEELFLYQKDAPGNLFKFFTPRIVAPPEMVEKFSKIGTKAFNCPNTECDTLLAMPTKIVGDDRPAMRIVGPIRSKVNQNGLYPIPLTDEEIAQQDKGGKGNEQ